MFLIFRGDLDCDAGSWCIIQRKTIDDVHMEKGFLKARLNGKSVLL